VATSEQLTPDDIVRRAQEARSLLANPLLQEATSKVEDALVRQWKTGKSVEEREAAWNRLRGLESVMKHLQIVMEQGEHPGAIRRSDSREP
jgi:hypothetical protein